MYAVKKRVSPFYSKGPNVKAKGILRVRRKDCFLLYCQSTDFRLIMDSGNYVYVSGYFILQPVAELILKSNLENKPLILALRSVGLLAAATEYCITYEIISDHKEHVEVNAYVSPRMFRRMHPSHAGKHEQYKQTNGDEFDDFVFGNGPPNNYSFGELLKLYMEKKRITVEELAEKTELDEKTIQRYRNNSIKRPNVHTVVIICLALHLLPSESFQLINSAGYCLRNTVTERAYQYLLNVHYNDGVHFCNHILLQHGLPPLIKYDGE